jgi:hypothetical protein
MLRKFVRFLLFLFVGGVAAGGILYGFGLRVVFDGGGGPQLVFTKFIRNAEEMAAFDLRK